MLTSELKRVFAPYPNNEKGLHSHLLAIASIFALLGIQFHNILHRNSRVIATHHISHLVHGRGNGLVVRLSHMHPLVHNYSITRSNTNFLPYCCSYMRSTLFTYSTVYSMNYWGDWADLQAWCPEPALLYQEPWSSGVWQAAGARNKQHEVAPVLQS